MTRWAFILGLVAISSAMCCVSKDQPSVHLVTKYQLRGAVKGKLDSHSIDALDGLGGYTINCLLGSKTNYFNFSAEYGFQGEKRSIAVNNHVTTPRCTVTVLEDNNYQTDCKVTALSATKPIDCGKDKPGDSCRVAVKVNGDTVTGTLCCAYLPMKGNVTKDSDYSLWQPNANKPVQFTVYNCK